MSDDCLKDKNLEEAEVAGWTVSANNQVPDSAMNVSLNGSTTSKLAGCEQYEELYERVRVAAAQSGKEHLVESAGKWYVQCLLRYQQQDNAESLLNNLQKMENARHDLHQLELTMNKQMFSKLVNGGFMSLTARDRFGMPVIWLRIMDRGVGSLSAKSPEEAAFIRAYIWRTEVAICQHFLQADKEKIELVVTMVIDERKRTPLHTANLRVYKEIQRLLHDMFPVHAEDAVIVGVPKLLRFAWNVIVKVSGTRNDRLHFVSSSKEAFKWLEDPLQSPDWFLGNGAGRSIPNNDRTLVWCYERCLCDDLSQKVQTKEVLDCQHWPYARGECGPELGTINERIRVSRDGSVDSRDVVTGTLQRSAAGKSFHRAPSMPKNYENLQDMTIPSESVKPSRSRNKGGKFAKPGGRAPLIGLPVIEE